MRRIAPDYYPVFSCIAGDCGHSCCVGWEIDIDEGTYAYYRTLPGEIGERIRAGIAEEDGCTHFVLCGEEERCPFLNSGGLCDIILTLGEGALCQICTDHPRYRNAYADCEELGLGLCCEAAAALILGWEKPVTLISLSDDGGEAAPDPHEAAMLAVRDAAIAVLQDRTRPMDARIAAMLAQNGAERCEKSPVGWAEFLLSLEILDPAWEGMLGRLHGAIPSVSLPEGAAEQLAVYLVYRHFPKIPDGESCGVLAAFTAFAYDLVSWLYAAAQTQSFDVLCDIVRMFSSEIEYSEDNLYAVFDEIAAGL